MAKAPDPMASPYEAAPDRYGAYRIGGVGASGLRLPAISLGLWQNAGDDRAIETQRAIVPTRSTVGSRTSIWPTTTGHPTARPKRTSVASCDRTCAPIGMS